MKNYILLLFMLPAMVLGQSKGYLGKRFIVNIENNIYLGRDSKGFTFGENKFLLGDHRSFKNRVLWGASFIASNKLLVYANYGNKSSLFAPPVFLSSVQNRVYYPTDATRAKEIRTSNTQVGLKFYGFGKTAFAPLGIYAGFAINYLTYDVDSLFFKSTTTSTFLYASSPQSGSFFPFTFTLGKSGVIANRIVLDYSVFLNISRRNGILRIPDPFEKILPVFADDETRITSNIEVRNYIEKVVNYNNLYGFKLSIGYLLF